MLQNPGSSRDAPIPTICPSCLQLVVGRGSHCKGGLARGCSLPRCGGSELDRLIMQEIVHLDRAADSQSKSVQNYSRLHLPLSPSLKVEYGMLKKRHFFKDSMLPLT